MKYLEEKKSSGELVSVFLKTPMGEKPEQVRGNSKLESGTKITYKMLSGKIVDFDDEAIRLDNEECLIRMDSVDSVKPLKK